MHLVTYNAKYSCMDVAMQHCDGLAVIGTMLDGRAVSSVYNYL